VIEIFMRKQYAIIFMIVLVVNSLPCNSQSSIQTVLQNCSRSIVKVTNVTTSNVGSGFICNSQGKIITSLHLVDGGLKLQVYYNGASVLRTATVEKIFKDADIALLTVDNPPANMPAITVSSSIPAVGDEVIALGYPLNISSVRSTFLKISFGGKFLKDIIPAKVKTELLRNQYPSQDIEIRNFEGNLVPGSSGSPIIDKQGNLVAIADGGLESGAVGICWGIPTQYIAKLMSSTMKQLPMAQGAKQLFGADLDLAVGQTLSTSGHELVKVRTRTFNQISATADDQLGLQQLSYTLGYQQNNFEYDIYQDFKTGATVVVPVGSTIQTKGDFWYITHSASSRLKMYLQFKESSSLQMANQYSIEFENAIGNPSASYAWSVDPQFSYMAPMYRYDGLVVNRKAAYGNKYVNYQWMYDKYLFETLATKNNVFLGYAVMNNDNTLATVQHQTQCVQYGLTDPACQQYYKDMELWAKMVLAVQLSSFSAN
jgi:hypothetical protein